MENRIKKLELLLEKAISCQADLLTTNKDLEHRLIFLEEQERSRARADHQREMALDFANAAGLSRAGM